MNGTVAIERIASKIYFIRGTKVMLAPSDTCGDHEHITNCDILQDQVCQTGFSLYRTRCGHAVRSLKQQAGHSG